MAIKHILFDLDGTLLPMVQDEFVRFYMPLLAKAYLKKGVEMDPKGFIGAVWKGYEAMVKNDGSRTNREAFWSYIDEFLPLSVEESEAIADAFYEDEFDQAKCTTQPTPLSDMVIKEAKKKGIEVYLATNPIFPRCATMNRIDWAGLDPEAKCIVDEAKAKGRAALYRVSEFLGIKKRLLDIRENVRGAIKTTDTDIQRPFIKIFQFYRYSHNNLLLSAKGHCQSLLPD